jgi:type II secretory pathway pseudopilin PulG
MTTVLRNLRDEHGQGLIELVAAISVLTIALLALVGGISSGYVTISRAGAVGTASVLADRTMEAYRGQQYAAVPVGTSTITYSSSSTPPSPDGATYTVTSTITIGTATNTSGTTARSVKLVSITVTNTAGRQLASEQSTIDPLTGQ